MKIIVLVLVCILCISCRQVYREHVIEVYNDNEEFNKLGISAMKNGYEQGYYDAISLCVGKTTKESIEQLRQDYYKKATNTFKF